ncbi:Endonuclease/exonuclease/phosphatase, partial [Thamnocephalis sphaerospora]
FALVDGYDAYFSFSRTRAGYAGVATYVRGAWRSRVRAAEEGLSNALNPGPGVLPAALSRRIALTADALRRLDAEGRCVTIDLGTCVVINLYSPHESDSDRLPDKLRVCYALERRVRRLIAAGREVCVVGDLNIALTRADHCDPAGWERDNGGRSFELHPPRRWLSQMLGPDGILVDLTRQCHPITPGLYTCWNVKINARPVNFGTRLDYILVSHGLAKHLVHCNVLQAVLGSDHCPVDAELSIVPDASSPVTEPVVPWLCTRLFREFSGTQTLLDSFFSARAPAPAKAVPSAVADTADRRNVSGAWRSMFVRPDPPRCRVHNEPCRELVTKKQGANYGRRFWVCSRCVEARGRHGTEQTSD